MNPLRALLLILTVSILLTQYALALEIHHVEPPNWWVGMKQSRVQIMVHGNGIAHTEPNLQYPGVRLTSVEHSDNPNYVFLNLEIAATTKPGQVSIHFTQNKRIVKSMAYRLEARRPQSAQRKSFSAADAIYLITPDRFANGDASNDSIAGMPDKTDRSIPTARHGGDIQGMRQHLDYIRDLGFTMIWPTPLLENNQSAYSYHGYALTDYYKIDARFGSNQEFRHYVQEANARGLGVIHDVVLNHIGTGHWWMKDMPAKDWLNYPESRELTNNQHTTMQDIHVAPEERERFLKGWFVPSMPDLNQNNPQVARYLIQNSIWWIEYANLSGIREDTFSYADPQFLKQWCKALLDEYPHLNIVGEEMDDRPHMVAYWQKGARNRDGYDAGLPSVMDFPVVDAMPLVLTQKENYDSGFIKLYELLAADYLYADPMKLLVFPDNHDRPRIFAQLDEDINLLKTSLLFTATVRGIPQIYYGTEVLISSPKERNDGLLRADMPGGWDGDVTNAFTANKLSAAQSETQEFVRKLFNWRKTSGAIHNGKLLHYLPQDGRYVYFRYTAKETVMVILNKSDKTETLDLHRFKAMIKQTQSGRNIMSGDTVNLQAPLLLPARTSIAIEWKN
ncbi:MAG: glycoside hydrolase family 13 protein [Burkholderiales bacterium]|nr:glycoside hydrolase family 13 protein [Burkholderiales bacterium]